MVDKNPFVFILGMHRSGTSCLAGCLERCGLYLGDVRRAGRFNARGYYELRSVERLHDQILGLNRAAWHRPPQRVQVHPYHRQALEEIADQLSRQRHCGLKDPRLVLLLDTWLELVAPPRTLVATFRHPLAVAQSLARRNGIPEEVGLKLWLHYNAILIRRHQAEPFPIVEFDLSNIEAYCRTVAALALELGLSPKLSQLRLFVSRELDHHPTADVAVPSACREAYAYLQRHRLRPDEANAHSPAVKGQQNMWSQLLDRGRALLPGAVQEVAFLVTRSGPTWFSRHGQRLLRWVTRRV